MRHSRGLQIADLEAIQSDFEQELTIEETKKVVGGSLCSNKSTSECKISIYPKIHITEPEIIDPGNMNLGKKVLSADSLIITISPSFFIDSSLENINL